MKRSRHNLSLFLKGLFTLAVSTSAFSLVQGQNPVAGTAQNIGTAHIILNPEQGTSPFNNGIFEGWGTSLCWWANRVGYSDKITNSCVDTFFDQTKGLMLNIVRYNVGGGDDPRHHHITRSDSNMPGFAQPVLDENGNFEVDGSGLVFYDYDWDRDKNQINVLKKIEARNKNVLIEVFSNSPPYFMTWSGCSSGGAGEHLDNLKPEYNEMFANFMADVVVHLQKDLKLKLNSVDPMNEPSSRYWKANSNKQEGCDFKDPKAQTDILVALDRALKKKGVRNDILIAASDETSVDLVEPVFKSLSPEAQKEVDRINTHTYGGSRREQAKNFVRNQKKHFWMSEVDGTGTLGGYGAGDMGSALWLAGRISEDVNRMKVSAWVIWQVIDFHHSDFNDKERRPITLRGAYWGLGYADHFDETIHIGKKYYAFGQYTRYIRPGDRIIDSRAADTASEPYARKVLSAYNKETGKVAIAVYNDSGREVSYQFDLSAFPKLNSSKVRVVRTSGAYNAGENWTEVESIPLNSKKFDAKLIPYSITTFVIAGTGKDAELPAK